MNKSEQNLAGAAAAVLLTTAGYIAGAVINPKPPKPPKAPKPICGCGHHYSMHGDGACSWTNTKKVVVERSRPRTSTDEYGRSTTTYAHEQFDYVQETCPCKTYAGPQHVPALVVDNS